MFNRILLSSTQTFRAFSTASTSSRISSGSSSYLAGGLLLGGLGYAMWNRETGSADVDAVPEVALNANEWRSFLLQEKKALTHDTALYRFGFSDSDQELGLPVAGCLLVRNNDQVENPPFKPYTPVSGEHQKGSFDLIVKTYPGGKVSGYFADLTPGVDRVQIKGPIKKIDIQANQFQKMTFVVGGSGITPAYQILKKLLDDPTDKTQFNLIYANKTESDVILAQELVALQQQFPDRLHIHFILTRPVLPALSREYITKELLQKELPPPSFASQKIFVCGPPAFYKSISGGKNPDFTQGPLVGYLGELGYTSEQVFKL